MKRFVFFFSMFCIFYSAECQVQIDSLTRTKLAIIFSEPGNETIFSRGSFDTTAILIFFSKHRIYPNKDAFQLVLEKNPKLFQTGSKEIVDINIPALEKAPGDVRRISKKQAKVLKKHGVVETIYYLELVDVYRRVLDSFFNRGVSTGELELWGRLRDLDRILIASKHSAYNANRLFVNYINLNLITLNNQIRSINQPVIDPGKADTLMSLIRDIKKCFYEREISKLEAKSRKKKDKTKPESGKGAEEISADPDTSPRKVYALRDPHNHRISFVVYQGGERIDYRYQLWYSLKNNTQGRLVGNVSTIEENLPAGEFYFWLIDNIYLKSFQKQRYDDETLEIIHAKRAWHLKIIDKIFGEPAYHYIMKV